MARQQPVAQTGSRCLSLPSYVTWDITRLGSRPALSRGACGVSCSVVVSAHERVNPSWAEAGAGCQRGRRPGAPSAGGHPKLL